MAEIENDVAKMIEEARQTGWRAGLIAAASVAEPPLMHRKGRVGLWRKRRAQIAADIRAMARTAAA